VSKQLPKAVNQFRKRHPKVWKAFNELGERCHEAGPLDEKSRRQVKIAGVELKASQEAGRFRLFRPKDCKAASC